MQALRTPAAAVVALVALLVACVPSGPRGSRSAGPVVRVALGVVSPAELPSSFRPGRDGLVRLGDRAYRGSLRAVPTDSGILVVNTLPLEDYLLGVVPLELGERPASERAALEAQAIAARSFAITRLTAARSGSGRSRDYDLVAGTADQVYGGHSAEQPNASRAVQATRGLVLLYGGRVIVAPYHSTCGGETAAAQEVWRSDGVPYLRRVSDRMPGRDERYYCDIAPRFYWERSLSGDELNAAVARYLSAYTRVPSGGPGAVRDIRVASRTPSGRVDELEIRAAAGDFRVRGNEARNVLRSASGETLPSPYFSVSATASSGGVSRVLFRGNGFGHGVGMCQWGAIGRARAGQGVRDILRTYFPGTTIGPLPSGIPSL